MSTKICLGTLPETSSEGNHVQYMPCSIEHNGDAEVDKYFTKYVTEETVTNEGQEEGEEKVLHGVFRGYPLTGNVLPTPEGYTGVVLKETRPGLNSEEPRTLRAVCQFKKFTFWNWDRKPSRGDRYQQAMDWTEIADLIHDSNN
ncbi:ribonuclease H2 subunit C-like [Macrobrachium nipponense]|uniref:ribonuclease H2 subunit C-like n=1 Tax=Macrobrachium nipponense TaxID=159736 RepID=UPI0030C89A4E